MSEELLEELQESDVEVVTADVEDETNVAEEPAIEEEVRFEWADLAIKCSCGAVNILEVNSPGNRAIQFILPPVEGKGLALQCPSCKHELTLTYQEASNPPAPVEETESTDDEQVQEEDKTEE